MKNEQIILSDCLEHLKTMSENSIDLCITDPPYGISFMGKDWDKFDVSNKPNGMLEFFVPIWKEVLRVLKPGAFVCIMSSPRQDTMNKQIQAIEAAGFVIGFTPIFWTYLQGFPKAHNISKALNKKAGIKQKIDAAKKFEGSYSGFQPKPAVEVILIAMKPLSKKTYIEQALANGKGVSWLDDCRISYEVDKKSCGVTHKLTGQWREWESNATGEPRKDRPQAGRRTSHFFDGISQGTTPGGIDPKWQASNIGRFPANLLVSDNVLDDGNKYKSGTNVNYHSPDTYKFYDEAGDKKPDKYKKQPQKINDKGTNLSRFFSLDRWAANLPTEVQRTFPFLVVPKASKREKENGLANMTGATVGDGRKKKNDTPALRDKTIRKNTHPTVKPVKLMGYLITMFSREGDVILDCFAGSGTTGLAAKILTRKYILIDNNPEYIKIAKKRLK